jgi:hypothetical protein
MKAAGSVMKAAGSVMKVRLYFLRRTLMREWSLTGRCCYTCPEVGVLKRKQPSMNFSVSLKWAACAGVTKQEAHGQTYLI